MSPQQQEALAVIAAVISATKYFVLIVFSGIAGAYLGSGAGLAISSFTGEPRWVAHGRCAGWTLMALAAAFRFVRLSGNRPVKVNPAQEPSPAREPGPKSIEPETTAGRLKSILMGPLIGAFAGLLLGGMAGGFLIALYFFAALSPLGPDGWWPILRLTSQSSHGGFSTGDPFLMTLWLIFVGCFVVAGICFGLFGTVSYGNRRFQVFRSKAD